MTGRTPTGRELFDLQDRWAGEMAPATASWIGHAVTERATLLGHGQRIRSAPIAPDNVGSHALDVDRERFYRHGGLSAPMGNLVQTIVAFFESEGRIGSTDSVVTAFPTHRTDAADRRKGPCRRRTTAGLRRSDKDWTILTRVGSTSVTTSPAASCSSSSATGGIRPGRIRWR